MNSDENMYPNEGPQSRRPTKLPTSALPLPRLNDLTDSEHNARAATAMPPPGVSALKHKPSGLPEPASKRKTLADRAGEPHNSLPAAPPSSRPVNSQVRATTALGVRQSSNTSSLSSASTRPTSSLSSTSNCRMTSGSSSTSRSGITHNSVQGHLRPHSAMSYSQHGFKKSLGNTLPGLTSVSQNNSEGATTSGAQKSMNPIFRTSSKPPSLFQPPKQRRRLDNWTDNIYPSCSSSSEASAPPMFGACSVANPYRDLSISTSMQQLSLYTLPENKSKPSSPCPSTPSYIPKPVPQPHLPEPPLPLTPKSSSRRLRKTKSFATYKTTPAPFLNRTSNTRAAWDTDARFHDMEGVMAKFMEQFASTTKSATSKEASLQDQIDLYKIRVNELESGRMVLATTIASLESELESSKSKVHYTTVILEDTRREQTVTVDDLKRQHRNELQDVRQEHRNELQDIKEEHRREIERSREGASGDLDRIRSQHAETVQEMERRLYSELEEERTRRSREVDDISRQLALQQQAAELDAGSRDREAQNTRSQLSQLRAEIEQQEELHISLKKRFAKSTSHATALEAELQAAKDKTHFLESDSQQQSEAFADLNARMQAAIESATEANTKLRIEETLRRKLHNQVQELKGNIRVFCRVRPTLESDTDESAKISFPDDQEDCKELMVCGPEQKSALGNVTISKNGFAFDRVFGPSLQNMDVFEEISQLVQSALDGYNVCIFCYGQTGSGKTHTMSSQDGMIPLAVNQIYETAHVLGEKGWKYSMEGSFVEVYNENLNDLLGKASEIDKKKLEILHDNQKGRTTISGVTTVELDSPETVSTLLKNASKNRSVAATKANERSSRSHSVFILKLVGENSITGERSEGTLNLVDLAGSERLKHSEAKDDRLKETQNINKSLSSLGDVISALGQGKDGGHIPYRNSKLTYLLQHSLGGNSKTLMFVMISPLRAHLSETITSLKFATKVHNTHIGTAKKQTKVRDA